MTLFNWHVRKLHMVDVASFSIATLIGCSINAVAVYQLTILACLSGIYSTTLMTVLNSRLKIVTSSPWQDTQADVELGTLRFHLPTVVATGGAMQSVICEEQAQSSSSTIVITGKE